MRKDRDTIAGKLIALASMSNVLERKLVLIQVLQLRGHRDLADAAGRTAVLYQERMMTLDKEIAALNKAECAAYRQRLERQIPMRPADSLDQESAGTGPATPTAAELLALMTDAEAAHKARTEAL